MGRNRGFWILGGLAIILLSSCAKPIANYIFTGERKAPADISFMNKSQDADSYLWDFGDGNTSTEASPIHQFKTSGNYPVELIAKKGGKGHKLKKRVYIEAPSNCMVQIQTDYGNMLIQLSDDTPMHRDNFVKLVKEGYYDGLLFHRIVEGFMIQGGDPRSRGARPDDALGSGGPGYQIPAEIIDTLVHVKGAIAGARLPDETNPDRESSGSQFYIVHGQPVSKESLESMEDKKGIRYNEDLRKQYLEHGGVPFLDLEYTVFGQIIDGFEVIEKLVEQETNEYDRPNKDIKMKLIFID